MPDAKGMRGQAKTSSYSQLCTSGVMNDQFLRQVCVLLVRLRRSYRVT